MSKLYLARHVKAWSPCILVKRFGERLSTLSGYKDRAIFSLLSIRRAAANAMLSRDFFPTKYASSTSLKKSSTTSLFSLIGLQEQKISAATQCSLSALLDFVEGVESLHRTSNTISAQQVGKSVRSLTDPNQTSYSIPIQNMLGERSQQSQPAGSKAVFPLPNTLKQSEWMEIPGQQPYTRSHVSNTLSLKGEVDRDILL